jgi:hypothetical protein
MVDRPDRDIETGAAGAGGHPEGDKKGKNEGSPPPRPR